MASNSQTVVFVLALTVFAPSVFFDFAYDDSLQILTNPQVTEGSFSLDTLLRVFREQTPGHFYRPLSTVTYTLTYLLVGASPWLFHLENVVLYAFACTLAYRTVLAISKCERIATYSSIIFAVHPIHVEAVANIIGRAELLAATLGMMALLLAHRASRSVFFLSPYFYLSMVSLFAALLAKESSVTIFLLLPFFLISDPLQRISLRDAGSLLGRLFPFVILILGEFVLRMSVLGNSFVPGVGDLSQVHWENPIVHFPRDIAALSAIKLLGDYVRIIVLPFTLSADYSQMPQYLFDQTFSPQGILSLSVVCALAAAMWFCRRRSSCLWLLWFFGSFSVSSNFFFTGTTIMGERLAFLPSLGLIAFLVTEGSRMNLKRGSFIAAVIITALTLRTLIRIPVWRNDEVLFRQTLADAPYSPKAVYNYGIFLLDDRQQPSDAKPYFLKVLEFFPNHLLSLMCLADIAQLEKDFSTMSDYYKRVLLIDPEQSTVRRELEKYEAYVANSRK